MEKRRKQVLAASFLAGAFAVTAGFAVQGHARAAQYRRMLDNTYQHAFTELATAAGELDVALRKVTYATSPELFSALCAQAYSKALAAQSALGELPYGNVELEQTAAFLAKTGDYAMALARDAYGETACTEAHRETLRGLAGAASTLSGALQSLLAELDAGTIRPEDVETVLARLSNATESGELPAGSAFQTAPFPTTCRAARPRCWRGCPRAPRRRPAGPRRPFWGYGRTSSPSAPRARDSSPPGASPPW